MTTILTIITAILLLNLVGFTVANGLLYSTKQKLLKTFSSFDEYQKAAFMAEVYITRLEFLRLQNPTSTSIPILNQGIETVFLLNEFQLIYAFKVFMKSKTISDLPLIESEFNFLLTAVKKTTPSLNVKNEIATIPTLSLVK